MKYENSIQIHSLTAFVDEKIKSCFHQLAHFKTQQAINPTSAEQQLMTFYTVIIYASKTEPKHRSSV